jgi:uncharacterized linocin/CFP29 family protein
MENAKLGDISKLAQMGGPIVGRALEYSISRENGTASGFVRALQHYGRDLSPYVEDAQKLFDDVIIGVGRKDLVIVRDILESGLTTPLPNPMAQSSVQWEETDDSGKATIGMYPNTQKFTDRPDFQPKQIPIYAVWSEFMYHSRDLAISARNNLGIDTMQAERSVRRVNEMHEKIILDGLPFNSAGIPLYGFLNHPDVNPYLFTGGVAWDDPAKTGADILIDMQAMMRLCKDDKFNGPFRFYLPENYEDKMEQDYSDQYPTSIMTRLEQLQSIESIRVAPSLPDDTVLCYQPTRDVVDMFDGQRPTVVPWQSPDGWHSHWMVISWEIPRIRSNYNDEMGVAVGTPV